ncbi:2'-5' RNA ligase family protein [Pleomorphomonas sp. PLEO]|uniref:2'-5' RNA ligase family protein n=1 Tax=Pleomorphomonas sp. PLEO TaxID=3239306 RepID=UPI00351F440E
MNVRFGKEAVTRQPHLLAHNVRSALEMKDAGTMPRGISIKCLNETASPVMKLWDEASSFESVASMRQLNYPPHITLAVLTENLAGVDAVLDDVFGSQPSLCIPFVEIRYFENDFLVLWARPRDDHDLLKLHARLHRHIDPAICEQHYRVGGWTPHCSLATRVPAASAGEAKQWAQQKRTEFTVVFDAADIVHFPPVVVEREHRLR